MYNKVKKVLNAMGYCYREFEKVEFSNGHLVIGKGFKVEKTFSEKVYIEITDCGEIDVWDEQGNHCFTVRKKETYLMMFELGLIM